MQLNFSDTQGGKIFNDQFGTVRLWEPDRFIVGNEFEVLIKGQSMGFVKVVAERGFDYSQIRDVLAYLETGKPTNFLASMLRKYYGGQKQGLNSDTRFVHAILQYTERNIENQRILLTDWWEKKLKAQPHPLPKETVFP